MSLFWVWARSFQEQSAGCWGKNTESKKNEGETLSIDDVSVHRSLCSGPWQHWQSPSHHDPREQERSGGRESHQQGGGGGVHTETGRLHHLHGDLGQDEHQHRQGERPLMSLKVTSVCRYLRTWSVKLKKTRPKRLLLGKEKGRELAAYWCKRRQLLLVVIHPNTVCRSDRSNYNDLSQCTSPHYWKSRGMMYQTDLL